METNAFFSLYNMKKRTVRGSTPGVNIFKNNPGLFLMIKGEGGWKLDFKKASFFLLDTSNLKFHLYSTKNHIFSPI